MNLKHILTLNAISSGATGVLLMLASKDFAKFFGVSSTSPFTGTGLFLVIFALLVGWVALRNSHKPAWIKTVVLLDALWVVASVVLITAEIFDLTPTGYLIIGAVALWVAAMAMLQYRGLAKLNNAGL